MQLKCVSVLLKLLNMIKCKKKVMREELYSYGLFVKGMEQLLTTSASVRAWIVSNATWLHMIASNLTVRHRGNTKKKRLKFIVAFFAALVEILADRLGKVSFFILICFIPLATVKSKPSIS